ncbi:hypothetical protein, partial [Bradyrhizobium sp. 153]|uniref:hypothetical protein n=1 Tax=Bradyrhizobium sp. 153 TaxID=2782627 RepID=UPI001FF8279F
MPKRIVDARRLITQSPEHLCTVEPIVRDDRRQRRSKHAKWIPNSYPLTLSRLFELHSSPISSGSTALQIAGMKGSFPMHAEQIKTVRRRSA